MVYVICVEKDTFSHGSGNYDPEISKIRDPENYEQLKSRYGKTNDVYS